MNLTSMRMVWFLTACVGLCTLMTAKGAETPPTTWYVSDTFEGASDGSLIGEYKRELVTVGEVTYTNNVWFFKGTNDLSKIVTLGYDYTGVRPLTDATTNNYLSFDTTGSESGELSRPIAFSTSEAGETTPTTFSFDGGAIFVDTLVKFVPSNGSDPEIPTGTRLAVFVNTDTNLVIAHTIDYAQEIKTNSVFGAIDPTKWYRLTIKALDDGTSPVFQVFTNDVPLTHANFIDGGNTCYPYEGNEYILNKVAFSGTGAIDDLSVSDGMAGAYSPPTVYLLTLAYDASVLDVTTNSASVGSNGTVVVGSIIAISSTLQPWNEIASVSGATYTGATGSQVTSSSGILTNDPVADATVTITAQAFTGATITTGLGADLPTSKVMGWAKTKNSNMAPGALTSAMLDEYLLNVAADTGNAQGLEIKSVTIIGDNLRITVGATGTRSGSVSFADLNGTLSVYTMNTLGGGETKQSYTVSGTTTATIDVPRADGKFMKVKVE